MKCFGTYIKKFSSTKLKTKDYECYKNIPTNNIMKNMMMKMEKIILQFLHHIEDMISQIESIPIVDYGISKAYFDFDIPI